MALPSLIRIGWRVRLWVQDICSNKKKKIMVVSSSIGRYKKLCAFIEEDGPYIAVEGATGVFNKNFVFLMLFVQVAC